MLDISTLPVYLENTRCAQVSSYDTTGGNDDGFSGKYSYLRKNADSSLVIFETKGPGVINRIWTPTPSDDSLTFYIDNTSRPAFTICYRDLFSGKVFPFVSPLCGNQLGGFYCYLPIPFRDHCKIIFKGKKTQFHQIQYRLYPMGTSVKKFSLVLDNEEKLTLQKIKSLWSKAHLSVIDFYPGQPIIEGTQSFELEPGQTHTVFKVEKGGRILGMEFEPASIFQGLTKQIDIRITWDDERTPSVLCPLADFFGYAFGNISMKSLLIGTDGNRNYSYFPMPFDKSATIELIYRKPDDGKPLPVIIQSKIQYTMQQRNPEKEGKFYATWKREHYATAHQPHVFLQTGGKGHYVGTLLQAQGLKSGMTYFFEGDDSTSVDGQFRMHGTGSEDYFNGGWYALPDRWDAPMSLPLSGALDYSLPFCRTGGFRLFLSDKISFQKNIHHSIEHGPVNTTTLVDYTSVGLYYNNAPPVSFEVPDNLNTKVFIPDTLMLYPQLMNMNIDGEITIRPEWAYPTGGETFFCTIKQDAALRISLSEIQTGDYHLFLDYVANPKGCSFSIWQRQSQVSEWVDNYKPTNERQGNKYLCDVHVDAMLSTLTLRFKTTQSRNQFIFNRLILIRK